MPFTSNDLKDWGILAGAVLGIWGLLKLVLTPIIAAMMKALLKTELDRLAQATALIEATHVRMDAIEATQVQQASALEHRLTLLETRLDSFPPAAERRRNPR